VGWLSPDVERCAEFYDKLGFRRDVANSKPPGLVIFEIDGLDLPIHQMMEEDEFGPLESHPGRCVEISFIVADINEIMRRCEENGIQFVGPKPVHAGFTGVVTQDPDGRKINFFQAKK
jgi:catechol 2,3-dioxygenase-like lactoylglutathione lyase family enzyme|tara:strand:- start:1493 stop:1846 length:354 start_codon:yes stop_codon:yes gene_type:complete